MTITRRAVTRGLAGLALAAPFVRSATAQERTVTLASFSGVFQENYRAAVVEPFKAAHPGIAVEYVGLRNSAETLGTLARPAQRAADRRGAARHDLGEGGDRGGVVRTDPPRFPAVVGRPRPRRLPAGSRRPGGQRRPSGAALRAGSGEPRPDLLARPVAGGKPAPRRLRRRAGPDRRGAGADRQPAGRAGRLPAGRRQGDRAGRRPRPQRAVLRPEARCLRLHRQRHRGAGARLERARPALRPPVAGPHRLAGAGGGLGDDQAQHQPRPGRAAARGGAAVHRLRAGGAGAGGGRRPAVPVADEPPGGGGRGDARPRRAPRADR
ncbi:exported protein of unknown function (plasmid) [Azospirillum baldaniorum]|uniref:Extracellular solute-binding protein n=1 Tax=Azospirillum baldaniorum TaxID=1064539 RepID=A0A9P1JY97_9PROT|nr:exported protein of unknown function [Azospirillum baldaniorum]